MRRNISSVSLLIWEKDPSGGCDMYSSFMRSSKTPRGVESLACFLAPFHHAIQCFFVRGVCQSL